MDYPCKKLLPSCWKTAHSPNGTGIGDWGLDDLRDCLHSGCYPIVGVERRYFGHPSAAHAVIIVNVRAVEIEMLDPLQGPAPAHRIA